MIYKLTTVILAFFIFPFAVCRADPNIESNFFGPSMVPGSDATRYYLIAKFEGEKNCCIASFVSYGRDFRIENFTKNSNSQITQSIFTFPKNTSDNVFGVIVFYDLDSGKKILDETILIMSNKVDGVLTMSHSKINLTKHKGLFVKVLQAEANHASAVDLFESSTTTHSQKNINK